VVWLREEAQALENRMFGLSLKWDNNQQNRCAEFDVDPVGHVDKWSRLLGHFFSYIFIFIHEKYPIFIACFVEPKLI
jgi:hypothetical protein